MSRRDELVLDSSTKASSGVGMVVPPMIKAVESGDGESGDGHEPESADSADATAGVVATAESLLPARLPMPRRDRCTLRYSSSFLHLCRRNGGHRVGSSSASGIVARVRCDEPSSAPLQSRPVSARYYLVAILSSRSTRLHGWARCRLICRRPRPNRGARRLRQWHSW